MPKKMKIPGWPDAFSPEIPGFSGAAGDNPLASSISGGLDFVKNLWGGLPSSVPGFIVPTVDVEELDKRIKDLKAVESWLEVNATMLRATIQGMEVQRNTIAAIQAISGSLGASSDDFFKAAAKAAPAPAPAPAPSHGGLPPGWPMSCAPAARPPREPSVEENNSDEDDRASPPESAVPPQTAAPAAAPSAADAPVAPQPALAATAWLDFLQDQFSKVASAAVAGAAVAESGKPARPARARSAAKKAATPAGAAKKAVRKAPARTVVSKAPGKGTVKSKGR